MGIPLSSIRMAAFADELEQMEKDSANILAPVENIGRWAIGAGRSLAEKGVKGLASGKENLVTLAKRVEHPVEGMVEGWGSMTPRLNTMKMNPKELSAYSQHAAAPTFWNKVLGNEKHQLEHLPGRKIFGQEGTLAEQGLGNKLRSTAEELSRRGWTGKSSHTKYLPVGEKGLTVGFPLLGVPGIVNAPQTGPTGEGGTMERALGDVGGTGGYIMGSGLGLITGGGAGWAGQKAGARLGRTLDRLRGGASLRTAWSAPSPEEASQQIEKIHQYYG